MYLYIYMIYIYIHIFYLSNSQFLKVSSLKGHAYKCTTKRCQSTEMLSHHLPDKLAGKMSSTKISQACREKGSAKH